MLVPAFWSWNSLDLFTSKDTFKVAIPGDYPYEYMFLWSGFYIGPTRLELKNRPPSDGNNRIRGPRIQVEQE